VLRLRSADNLLPLLGQGKGRGEGSNPSINSSPALPSPCPLPEGRGKRSCPDFGDGTLGKHLKGWCIWGFVCPDSPIICRRRRQPTA
jgi:hypothetical protein